MEYYQKITLKNGQTAILRNGNAADGAAALAVFLQTHQETDYLLTYPDESTLTPEQESQYLAEKAASADGIEIVALVDGRMAGTAGVAAIGTQEKVRHRADFGIGVLKEYWGLGLGKALMEACIACAKKAGYTQLELSVVADNASAMALYEKEGFVEFGRNPRGFKTRSNGYQPLVSMLKEL